MQRERDLQRALLLRCEENANSLLETHSPMTIAAVVTGLIQRYRKTFGPDAWQLLAMRTRQMMSCEAIHVSNDREYFIIGRLCTLGEDELVLSTGVVVSTRDERVISTLIIRLTFSLQSLSLPVSSSVSEAAMPVPA